MKTVTPFTSIGLLLLLCAAVTRSLESQDEEHLPGHENGALSVMEEYLTDRGDRLEKQNRAEIPGVCFVCKKIINSVKKLLGKSLSGANIGEKLDQYCAKKKDIFKRICRTLINKYKNKLIQFLLHKDTANSCCVKIKLCKGPPPRAQQSS
ncbi:non-pathogenic pore-forming peptide amoebapore A [Osmerus mordax]|uniref:non-pathogenic pore-forming peptide amoebapore A n=1 Tax=Osmerus mordax TaxID=8014 RepID=UPI003510259A